jgi:hypothetical protein
VPPEEPALLDPAPTGMLWEAAWTPGGALCLGRKRWDALANGDLCGGRLKDPRITRDDDAFYCEEAAIGRPASGRPTPGPVGGGSDGPYFPPGSPAIVLRATLSNQSYVIDLPLRTWQSAKGDYVTTTQWRLSTNGEEGAPPAGYRLVRTDGPIYHPDIIADAKPAVVVPLYLWTPVAGGPPITTSAPSKTGTRTLLGFVFPTRESVPPISWPVAIPLTRYRSTVTGRYLTTTVAPTPASEWVVERLEGYLPRGPMAAPPLRLIDVRPLPEPRFPLPLPVGEIGVLR